MSPLGGGTCDRRRGGRCRGPARRRPSPVDQLALFSAEPATCQAHGSGCHEASVAEVTAEARCRALMFAQLVVPVQDFLGLPSRRLEDITAIVVEGPEGRPLAVVTDEGLRQLYRNIVVHRARTSKAERQRSERAMDEAVAQLERLTWYSLRVRADRLARGARR